MRKKAQDTQMIDEIFSRGVSEVIGGADLRRRMESGERLRIKIGIDPTSPAIHIGRAAALLKLRDFQRLGHTIVFIVGDFTGIIGDTSDKDSERPMLSENDVARNMKTYFSQAGTVLDIQKTEKKKNSTWLKKLRYADIGKHANFFSVSDFIARENIKRRLDLGKRVSLRELLYPLLQGYDSVAIKADLEVGGTDQRFNMLAGRTLQEGLGYKPQAVMTLNLLPGTDGRKMSSSWGNTINVTDKAADMYGKIMSVSDDAIMPYFTSLTRVPEAEVRLIEEGIQSGGTNPKDAKMTLAREITALFHGKRAALKAQDDFVATFQKHGVPEEIPEYEKKGDETIGSVLVIMKMAESLSDAQRLAKGGAIKNMKTGEIFPDARQKAESGTYKIGKRKFLKII